ncbi:hypothetical protein [Loktanella sp. PT4BL]|uniref:hypothetical protein n=1 Tax=Loktanella sp. PT4BL TaxID=2135611 RepID=UPI0011B7B503|nr:hypothetical protein [Loktanella sp. PT4BL]
MPELEKPRTELAYSYSSLLGSRIALQSVFQSRGKPDAPYRHLFDYFWFTGFLAGYPIDERLKDLRCFLEASLMPVCFSIFVKQDHVISCKTPTADIFPYRPLKFLVAHNRPHDHPCLLEENIERQEGTD